MKKGIIFIPLIILFALVQSRVQLWSGNQPDLLLAGLIGLTGSVAIVELILYTLIGFLFLAGPIVSQELLVLLVIVAFTHFLRLFVFGPSPVLLPVFSAIGIIAFYLETVGFVIFSNPFFIFEILFVSLIFSLLPLFILRLSELIS